MTAEEIKALARNEAEKVLAFNDLARDIKFFGGKTHGNGDTEFPAFKYRGHDVEIWFDGRRKEYSFFVTTIDGAERQGGGDFQSTVNKAKAFVETKPPR